MALNSGSCANTIHPDDCPEDAQPDGNYDGPHFNGAGGDRIQRSGRVTIDCKCEHGTIRCGWDSVDVTKPLHSVSVVAGPADGPGLQDVLINNKAAYVVPPCIVEEIMGKVRPVAEYEREGALYVADMTVTSFHRPGQNA